MVPPSAADAAHWVAHFSFEAADSTPPSVQVTWKQKVLLPWPALYEVELVTPLRLVTFE